PYIHSIFSIHQNSSPERIEALITRYAPETLTAQTAEQVIQMLKTKAFTKTREWLQNGGTAGVAAQMLGSFTGNLGAAFSTIGAGISNAAGSVVSGIGSLFFKENTGGAHLTQSPQAVMNSLGKGQPIESSTRSKMEDAFGESFSDVEIHTDNNAAKLSRNMNARAFTVGNHIAFAQGEHKPGDLMGDALMAHELAHTVQQKGGETSGAQMKGAEYNALEADADNVAVNVMSKLNGGKDRNIQTKVKKGLTISRCNGGGSPSPTPSPTPGPVPPPPAPTLPPEFQVTGLPANTARYRTKIFFDRNSTAIAASEEAKLTAIGTGSTTVEADLHGYSSEDETVAGIETNRITAVDSMLGVKGHTAARHPLPHVGAGTGIIDYRQMRAVEIRRTGTAPSTPNCIDPITGLRRTGFLSCSPATQFTTAQSRASAMLTRAMNALNAGAITPVAQRGLGRFFGTSSASQAGVAATVRANLGLLKTHINIQMAAASTIPSAPGVDPGPGHLCGDECETGCSGGTIAYNSGRDAAATMVLCLPFMADTNVDSRAETLIHEGLHGITLTGVTTRAGSPTNAKDFTYDWQRLINFLDTPTALRNNDSYVLFVRQIMNPTATIEGGQAPGSRDTISGVAPGSAEETDIKVVIGYMESWFEKADQDLSSLHGTIVDTIAARSWTNSYYENIMSITAPHFGLTPSSSLPTEMDKFKVAGISNRVTRIRNTFGNQLAISKVSTPVSVWGTGPGTTVTLGDDFFAAGSRRAKLDLLILKIIEANPEIIAAHRAHYATLVNELRTNGERGAP
ncbi:MAG: DUF4157 domain-containing protein, partial [Dinghuibacter sp.]|nr:DUF4157 domain-containing protein [Dinghuibacter sp.]